MSKTDVKVFGFALFACAGLSVACLAWGAFKTASCFSCRNWPQAKGRIVSSEFRALSESKGRHSYYPDVVYRYSVARKEYESKRISFHDAMSSDREFVNGIVERYAEGREVAVFYHPTRHDLAVLEPGFKWTAGIVAPFVFGLVLLGIAVFKILPKFLHHKRQQRSQQPDRARLR